MKLIVVYKLKLNPSATHLDPRLRVLDMRPDIQKSNSKQDSLVICQCILITLVFFYLLNLKTRFDETLGRISEPKNLSRGIAGQSSNLDSNPRPDIKTLGRQFKSSAESFRCAAGHLKFRYQTRCSNLLLYINNIGFLLTS